MTAHYAITIPQSPRAFDAIFHGFAFKGHEERTVYTRAGDEFTAFFETEVDPYGGMNARHEVCAYTRCTLVGAYDFECTWAGNREELIELIGLAEVEAWEAYAEIGANE